MKARSYKSPGAARWLGIVAAALILVGSAGNAAGQEDFTKLLAAQELYRQAEFQFKAEQYKQALSLYKKAYETKPLPTFLFNIGQCHHLLGQCRLASAVLLRFLTTEPDDKKKEDVNRMIASCKPAPGDSPPPMDPVTPPGPAVVEGGPGAQPGGEEDILGNRKILLWGGAGLSAALLITGAVTGGMAQARSNDYNDLATPPEDLADLRESGIKLRNAAVATLALGAGAALGTALIYMLSGPADEEAPSVSLAPLQGGGALGIGGRF